MIWTINLRFEGFKIAIEPENVNNAIISYFLYILWIFEGSTLPCKSLLPSGVAASIKKIRIKTVFLGKDDGEEMLIRGRVIDLQPNQDKPVLELNFKFCDKTFLPQGRCAEVKLDLGEAMLWRGTINSEQKSPYLHTHLSGNNGEKITCTDLFLRMGLAEKALLEFKRELDGTLRLIKIVERGNWRDRNAGGQRREIIQPTPGRASGFSSPVISSLSNNKRGNIDRLVASLSSDFPVVIPSSDKAWTRPFAVRVIDCVLSLNRKYDGFVVPRLDTFEKNFPEVKSIRDLHELIAQYSTPSNFVLTELNYNHYERARILSAVLDYLIGMSFPWKTGHRIMPATFLFRSFPAFYTPILNEDAFDCKISRYI